MKKILKNYKSTLILIFAMLAGTALGLIFKEKITVLKPFGDLFLNALLIIIVPIIFLTISTAIGKMNQPKRIGKILVTIFAVCIVTSIISVAFGMLSATNIKLVNVEDGNRIKESLENSEEKAEISDINYLEKTVNTISVDDFSKLLSRDNMIALIIFSIIFGIAINLAKEKGKPLLNVLQSANEVMQKVIKIIMYYAPVGIGCYFATIVGSFGNGVALGYVKTFIIYTMAAILFYFIVYSLYAFISAGKKGFILFWKNILPATLTALATCSSAASIPISTACAKKMGVSDDIADTTIPLGTNFHKDGSIIGSVFKIMFLVCLFNSQISGIKIFGLALLATLLVSAIPIGGGTISEMLIITMLGFPVAALPILTIIATIIDAPATTLNVVGNTASSMIVSRIIDGPGYFKKKTRILKKAL